MGFIDSKEGLIDFISLNWAEVNSFIDDYSKNLPVPIYSSVDLRESSNKIAPVDQNIYPAGFNNLCNFDLAVCIDHFKQAFDQIDGGDKKIAIIPESHTKNLFYLDHLCVLGRTIEAAGYGVSFISFDEAVFLDESPLLLSSSSQGDLLIERGKIVDGQLCTAKGDKAFSLALLNHDQSNPIDIEWESIQVPVVPTPKIGWFARQKNKHFTCYSKVIDDFCHRFDIDPYLLQARFRTVDGVDFIAREGLEKIAAEADDLLKELPESSNLFVKASQGTYGMGISVISKGSDILAMNRKKRNKMAVGKNRINFSSVLIQEGVETIIKYDDQPAEVSIYLINGASVGGFMRTNPLRTSISNLNAKGMVFQKFCISEIKQNVEHKAKEATYSVIARLSTIASAMEIEEALK